LKTYYVIDVAKCVQDS